MATPRITIFDTTLRDGEQSPGCSMNGEEKSRLARQLAALGVDVIEAGFPVASDGDFAAVQAIAAAVPRPANASTAASRQRVAPFLPELTNSSAPPATPSSARP